MYEFMILHLNYTYNVTYLIWCTKLHPRAQALVCDCCTCVLRCYGTDVPVTTGPLYLCTGLRDYCPQPGPDLVLTRLILT